MFRAKPFANVFSRRDFVIDLERSRRVGLRVSPRVFRVKNGVDVVLQNRAFVDRFRVGRFGVEPVRTTRRREQVPALRASRVSRRDDRRTLRTLPRRRRPASRPFRADDRHIDRPETNDVLPVIEDEAIRFPRREPKPPPNHLLVKPGRVRRSKQNDAVDVRRVEAGRQNVDVDKVFERRRFAPEQIDAGFVAFEPSDNVGSFRRVRFAGNRRDFRARQRRERLFDPPRRLDARRENENLPTLARQFGDLQTRRFKDVLFLDDALDLGRDELAAANRNVRKIGSPTPGARFERRQVTLRD